MAGSKPPRHDQPSIKYRFNPLEGPVFEVSDFHIEDYAPNPSDDNKQSSKKFQSQSSEILSTAEFISAVGQIWSHTNRSLAVFLHKENLRSEENIFCYQTEPGNGGKASSSKGKYVFPHRMAAGDSPPSIHGSKCLNVTEKMSFFKSSRGNWKEIGPGTARISYGLENMYKWMSEKTILGLGHLLDSTQTVKTKSGESFVFQDTTSPATSSCLPGDTITHTNEPVIVSADHHSDTVDCFDSSSCQNVMPEMNMRPAITSLCSDYHLGPNLDIDADGSFSRTLSSRLQTDYNVSQLELGGCALEESEHKTGDYCLYETRKNEENEFITEDEAKMEICSSMRAEPRHALAKQEHAFAGAFAGVFVSLCLHPMDTIKTVVQSCHADQKSIGYISRSIISERGVTGLYRGFSSNIASSAPISAVYTFTYESVKGALLPLFSKEYHSFAHCVAGGCASIATSFIFTPSERIKQQLQVGSHYQNCWNALVGIIEKGGLSSLYAGWGAVLCRNVPHSIIKFYTYESLKQLMVSSLQPNAQPNTLQTLVCGGLAGSTAALFTTPFDVVKTRLQTQIPGSVSLYDGVFNTLKEIAKHEGVRGLYRGLTPRLVMYMTQGALFFASYETFKRLFSLDVPQLGSQTNHYKKNIEDDDSTSLLSSSSQSLSSLSVG